MNGGAGVINEANFWGVALAPQPPEQDLCLELLPYYSCNLGVSIDISLTLVMEQASLRRLPNKTGHFHVKKW